MSDSQNWLLEILEESATAAEAACKRQPSAPVQIVSASSAFEPDAVKVVSASVAAVGKRLASELDTVQP